MLHNKACAFGNEKVEFPIHYHIKVIMDATESDKENKEILKNIFNNLKINTSEWKYRLSKKGNYISFTVKILVEDKKTFDELYKQLNEHKSVKWAV